MPHFSIIIFKKTKQKNSNPGNYCRYCNRAIMHLSAQLAETITATLTLITSQFEASLLVYNSVIKTLFCFSAFRAAHD